MIVHEEDPRATRRHRVGRHPRFSPCLMHLAPMNVRVYTLSRCPGFLSSGPTYDYCDGRPGRLPWSDLEPTTDTFRPLCHDRKTIASLIALIRQSLSVVRHFDESKRGVDCARDPQVCRECMLSSVCDGLL